MPHIVTQGYFDVPEHVSNIISTFYTLLGSQIGELWSQNLHKVGLKLQKPLTNTPESNLWPRILIVVVSEVCYDKL